MPGPNQLDRMRSDVSVTADDLLRPVAGTITEQGLRSNIRIAMLYLSAWLGGNGCVPIDNLMEDAATAEISRTQLWQWIRHPGARLENGAEITSSHYLAARRQILETLMEQTDKAGNVQLLKAAELLDDLVLDDDFAAFLTLQAYEVIS